jgi:Protein of unknown function (DUF2769)
MDKFEEKLNQLNKMSEDEKNKEILVMKDDCICPVCPTYNICAKNSDEMLFCVIGKSNECITKERGCMCPTCPFARKYSIGIQHNFYCIRDSEMEQKQI